MKFGFSYRLLLVIHIAYYVKLRNPKIKREIKILLRLVENVLRMPKKVILNIQLSLYCLHTLTRYLLLTGFQYRVL